MGMHHVVILAVLLSCGVAQAQDDDLPDAQDLAQATAQRFPQPVRVGDLINRYVLEPVESQTILGRVRAVVKEPDGTIAVVMNYGGFFGFFGRPIAIPVNAMTLLGADMEVMDYEPGQLQKFPTFNPATTRPLPPDSTIRVGLAKPAH